MNAMERAWAAGMLVGEGDELITLAEAARRLPRIDGRKVCDVTLWRWARRGLRGVRLEYVRVGRIYTAFVTAGFGKAITCSAPSRRTCMKT